MNVIIVDDEPLAQEVIETYISKFPALNLIAKCSNAVEAFDVLNSNNIDLMFLDIQMPQISGIDFLKTLPNPPQVIFTTAYSEYAMDGYELNVVDYLLKPISLDRFAKAVNKAVAKEQQIQENEPNLPTNTEPADYIFVKADKKLIKIRFDQINYIEGLKDYVILHTPNGRVVTLQTMKSLEIKLPSDIFMRVHRSFIVNLANISVIEGNTVQIEKKIIPIGKNYKDVLLNIINKNRL
ncbi:MULTISPECIES: LytTR family DNA-binding domain-containing protein [unclassified Aureispira]|uniref:LytR/AlgR family response regulator transcription factor n=1 Tax=unclassified Aureispira TaxID=2649989 RepID=UPI0006967501|nr:MULTISPECIES: LytTR family DNA-binding domain-containing protein [unclassified Aureispira]WMX17507.1 LytTR family DNA-binding domain-containing protein [Aureispira sp. CCB-E]